MLRFIIITLSMLSATINSPAQSIVLGSNIWADKNLDNAYFQNGDIIPEARTDKEWANANKNEKPAWCYYINDAANGKQFGRLYNFYAVMDKRSIAPKGWHIATDMEWQALIEVLGNEDSAGHTLKEKFGWKNNGNGNNNSGFGGLPGGARNSDGEFVDMGSFGYWWSRWVNRVKLAYSPSCWFLTYNASWVGRDTHQPGTGFSVRCVKD